MVDLTSPSYILQNLPSLTALPPSIDTSSRSRQDTTKIICGQVCFLVGAVVSSLKDTPSMQACLHPEPRALPGALPMTTTDYSAPKPQPKAPQFLIGLIGCGQVGTLLLNKILSMGFPPSCICVSSRDEGKISSFTDQGVISQPDLSVLSRTCRIILLCVAPQHLRKIGETMSNSKSSTTRRRRKNGEEDGSGALIISLVAGVPSKKISHILGLTRVVRTFVDMQMVPVSWSCGTEGTPSEDEVLRVCAKNLVAENGAIRFLQASVEDLCMHLGMDNRAAKTASIASVVGDPDIKPLATTPADDGVDTVTTPSPPSTSQAGATDTDDAETNFGVAHAAMMNWKNYVAPLFHEVFAVEVFAKDLPSLL